MLLSAVVSDLFLIQSDNEYDLVVLYTDAFYVNLRNDNFLQDTFFYKNISEGILSGCGFSVISDQGQGSLTFLSSASYFKSALDNTFRLTILASGVKLYSQNLVKLETIGAGASVYNQLNVASFGGGASGLSSHYGALRYGDEGGSEYSTRRSLDLINTDSGNINYYLNINIVNYL